MAERRSERGRLTAGTAMTTLTYYLDGTDPAQGAECVYSILSALKHAAPDRVPRIVVICADQILPDGLPVEIDSLPEARPRDWSDGGAVPQLARLHALKRICQNTRGKVCLIDTCTDFRANPGKLFDRIGADTALVHTRSGHIRDLPHGAWPEVGLDPETPVLSTGVLGFAPDQFHLLDDMIAHARLFAGRTRDTPGFDAIAFAASAVLPNHARIETCADIVVHYADHRRHIYRGRLRHMFPKGQPVSAAMAPTLPRIKEPPTLLLHRLRARVFATRVKGGPAGRDAYLAYLTSRKAPNATARSVWADIALDHLQRAALPPETIRKHFGDLVEGAPHLAGLASETRHRWAAFWADTD